MVLFGKNCVYSISISVNYLYLFLVAEQFIFVNVGEDPATYCSFCEIVKFINFLSFWKYFEENLIFLLYICCQLPFLERKLEYWQVMLTSVFTLIGYWLLRFVSSFALCPWPSLIMFSCSLLTSVSNFSHYLHEYLKSCLSFVQLSECLFSFTYVPSLVVFSLHSLHSVCILILYMDFPLT